MGSRTGEGRDPDGVCRGKARATLASWPSVPDEPASTQFRNWYRYSSSTEKPLLQAVQVSTTGRFSARVVRR